MLTFAEIVAQSNRRWIDVTHEGTRTYIYPNGQRYVIEAPVALGFRAGGAHTVIDGAGNIHQLPTEMVVVRKFQANPDLAGSDD